MQSKEWDLVRNIFIYQITLFPTLKGRKGHCNSETGTEIQLKQDKVRGLSHRDTDSRALSCDQSDVNGFEIGESPTSAQDLGEMIPAAQ